MWGVGTALLTSVGPSHSLLWFWDQTKVSGPQERMARSCPIPEKKQGVGTLSRICSGWGLRVWRCQAGLGSVRKEARWWPC